MIKQYWKRIALLLIGLDVVVFGSALVLSAFKVLGGQRKETMMQSPQRGSRAL